MRMREPQQTADSLEHRSDANHLRAIPHSATKPKSRAAGRDPAAVRRAANVRIWRRAAHRDDAPKRCPAGRILLRERVQNVGLTWSTLYSASGLWDECPDCERAYRERSQYLGPVVERAPHATVDFFRNNDLIAGVHRQLLEAVVE